MPVLIACLDLFNEVRVNVASDLDVAREEADLSAGLHHVTPEGLLDGDVLEVEGLRQGEGEAVGRHGGDGALLVLVDHEPAKRWTSKQAASPLRGSGWAACLLTVHGMYFFSSLTVDMNKVADVGLSQQVLLVGLGIIHTFTQA